MDNEKQILYRVAGMNQILELIECGYIEPTNSWSFDKNICYQYKRPVISVSIDVLKNDSNIISITDLDALWIYNHNKKAYENKLKEILNMYQSYQVDKSNIDINEKCK